MGMSSIVILLCLGVVLFIGYLAGQNVRDIKGFSVAKNSYGPFALMATIATSFLGAGLIIGTAEQAFSHGIVYIICLGGFCLQLILTAFFISPRIHSFQNILSLGDIIKETYGHRAQVIMGFFWTIFCIGIVTVQITALGNILNLFFPIDINLCKIIVTLVIVFYCCIGGIKSVVATDVVQFILMFVAISSATVLGFSELNGFNNIKSSVPDSYFTLLGDLSLTQFSVIFLSFLVGEAMAPSLFQRLLMTRSRQQATLVTLMAGIIMGFVFTFAGFLGIIAFARDNTIDATQVIPFVFNSILPIWFKGIAIAGILAIIISAADCYLNSASVSFINDIFKPKFKDISTKTELYIARIVTILLGMIALVISFSTKNILDILLGTYKFWAPTMLVPIIGIFFHKTLPRPFFYYSVIVSALFVILWEVLKLEEKTEINSIVAGFVFSAITYLILFFAKRFYKRLSH